MNFKLILLSVFITLFVTACNSSASTDAKQVVATPVTKVSESISNTSVVQNDDAMK